MSLTNIYDITNILRLQDFCNYDINEIKSEVVESQRVEMWVKDARKNWLIYRQPKCVFLMTEEIATCSWGVKW